MSEKWSEYYEANEIKKIQAIELESLKVFSNLCKELGIDFFLYGGSLLGAIKYNGFVPWDDDLDVALLRPDYEKLLEKGPTILPVNYELQHPGNNKVTPFLYAKFRRTDTELVEYPLHKLKMNHGVYFDIYPIDNLPDDNEELNKCHSAFQVVSKIFYYRQVSCLSNPVSSVSGAAKQILRYAMRSVLMLVPHSLLYKIARNIMVKFNGIDTERKGNYFHPHSDNFFDAIYPLTSVKFEGFDMKVPAGYSVNLEGRYGDISKTPPAAERVGHKAYIVRLEQEGEDVN